MASSWLLRVTLCCLCVVVLGAPAMAENDGLPELDKATQLKATAESMKDLNEVVDHLELALEKGLDKENTDFAEQLLVASLVQRGTLFANEIANVTAQDPQRGLRIIQLRQFALSDLQRAVELDEDMWEAHLMLGKLHMQALPVADPGAARRALKRVVDAEDAGPELRAEALALRSAVQRDDEKRLEDLNQAIELQPEKPEFLRLRAQQQFSKEKFEEALADVDIAIKLDPEHAMTHELRGVILLGLEKPDEALDSFNRATELVPDASLPYQHRGELYRQKGDLEKALEQLTKAVELASEPAQEKVGPLLVRAGIYYELKQSDKALADIEEAIRLRPDLVQPHLMQVEIYAATDRLDQAITHLERLVQLAPKNAQLLSRLGSFYLMGGRPRKAIETLTLVIDQDPQDFSALSFRGDAYLGIGQHAEAIADFERAYAVKEEDDRILNNYAWVLATSPDDDLRDGEKAVKMATKAAELTNHQAAHILSTLGAAYAETGDFENAKKWSQQAVELQQKAVEAAEDDEDRTKLQADLEQLRKELANYEEGKPVRERQETEEATGTPPADNTATPETPSEPSGSTEL